MNLQTAPDYFELSDYLSVLRRRWRTVAVMTLIGVVLAGLYLVAGPKKYTATVLVQVNALPNNANAVGGRTGGPVNMDNEGQAVQSAAVASIVKARIHSPLSVTDLVRHIHVTVPPNSTFLQITCDASSAIVAQQCANATGKAYLFTRRANIDLVLNTGIKALQARATKLRGNITRLKTLLFETRHKKGVPAASPVLVDDALQLTAAQNAFTSVQQSIDTALPLLVSMAAPDSVIAGGICHPGSTAHRPVESPQAARHPERPDRGTDPRPGPGFRARSARQARPRRPRRRAPRRPAHAAEPRREGPAPGNHARVAEIRGRTRLRRARPVRQCRAR